MPYHEGKNTRIMDYIVRMESFNILQKCTEVI